MSKRTIIIEVESSTNDLTQTALDSRVKDALGEFTTGTRELSYFRKGPFGSVKIEIKEEIDEKGAK